MRSTFASLEIGRRSIMAHQSALNVTGHNVANVNTPGYTRQDAVMVTTPPYCTPSLNSGIQVGQFGTGVQVSDIRRLRDDFIDLQIRDENRTTGYWQSMEMALDKIEVVLNEPTKEGLRGVLDSFWSSWQALSESPENESVRAVVLQRGHAVVDTFNHMYAQLADLRQDLNAQVKARVDEVNSMAQQIADLNQQIQAITISGQRPNDLTDSRDLLLDQLSEIVDTHIVHEVDGMVTVMVGGTPLIQGINHSRMGLNTDAQGLYKVVWDLHPEEHPGTSITGNGVDAADPEVVLQSGALLGLLDARGQADNSTPGGRGLVPGLIEDLNLMAKTLVLSTNYVHRQGYSLNNTTDDADGFNFFVQPDDVTEVIEWAKLIEISKDIADNPQNIAAAKEPTYKVLVDDDGNPVDEEGNLIEEGGEPVLVPTNFGDGANALKIAQIKHYLFTAVDQDEYQGGSIITGGTIDDFWRSQVSTVGVLAQEARRMVENQETLVSQLELKRQATAGVSLDEEMMNMIRFQHAYNAAARYITTIDETIEVIVNRMGLVGR
jgi:flagellar hook-associated protein 1 FlgK